VPTARSADQDRESGLHQLGGVGGRDQFHFSFRTVSGRPD
jgi:hypothetical protein